MKTSIRIFNEDGIEEFRRLLQEIKSNEIDSISDKFLTDGYFSDIASTSVDIENIKFATKRELIISISKVISKVSIKNLHFNRGLWSWLAAFYFESICPKKKDGTRVVGDEGRYILNSLEWNRYYRHLLASPFRLFVELEDLSEIYLAGKPDKPGDLFEQLASRQEIATCKAVIEASTLLYWDKNELVIKKGARNKDGAGVLRRFTTATIPQFQMTYDLNSMTGSELLKLLPPEYDVWKKN